METPSKADQKTTTEAGTAAMIVKTPTVEATAGLHEKEMRREREEADAKEDRITMRAETAASPENSNAAIAPQAVSENQPEPQASPPTPNREAGGQRNAMTSRQTKYFLCLVYSPLLLFHLL